MASRFAPIKKRHRFGFLGNALPVLFFLAIILLFHMGVAELVETQDSESLAAVERAIVRATVQAYALEGQYPPNIEYLQERFGLSVDLDKYIVHFDAFASNIMPKIVVLPRYF